MQSISESSFDAWIKFYRPNENSGNATSSYYTKGSVVGLALNLLILHQTKGAKSLDDVMRAMYERYYKTLDRPYTETEFKQMLESIAGSSFDDFFARYVHGTEQMPIGDWLRYAGFELKVLDNSGKSYLGASLSPAGTGRLFVNSVQSNSPAMKAGLYKGDIVTQVNGKDAYIETLGKLDAYKTGDALELQIEREGKKMSKRVLLAFNPFPGFEIIPLTSPSTLQTTIRKKWLGR